MQIEKRHAVMRSQWIMLVTIVLPAIFVFSISTFYLIHDWLALIRTYHTFEQATALGNMKSIQIAYDYQSIYRKNCFADGLGSLAGLLLLSIGVVGICLCSTWNQKASQSY